MSLPRQFSIFLVIGGLCTGLHYAILIALIQLVSVDPVWASAIGFCLSAVLNYLLNRRLTFGSSRAHAVAAPRFAGVATSGLAINTGVLALVNGVMGWHYLVAQLLATGATLVWNFGLHKLWTFADPKGQRFHQGDQGL